MCLQFSQVELFRGNLSSISIFSLFQVKIFFGHEIFQQSSVTHAQWIKALGVEAVGHLAGDRDFKRDNSVVGRLAATCCL